MTTIITIDTNKITDWDTFHDVFAEAFGFPDFYGRNMDAWIDCLTYLDEDDEMSAIKITQGEILTLQLDNVTDFAQRCPEQYAAIIECSAFVNYRRIVRPSSSAPVLALSFYKE